MSSLISLIRQSNWFVQLQSNIAGERANRRKGRAHLLLVSSTPGHPDGALGVVTLEGTTRPLATLTQY